MTTLLNRCPSCGGSKISSEKATGCIFVLAVLVSFGLALLCYPFLPVTYRCRDCGARWKP